ncbi:hypothetical protein MNBD_PLANCTO02-1149 [hydrothermal vent metagenome]|uniref:Uncharacterized protein n=1 Tax=hydrothermal vent metagenome TaxID=652676 RepID=A0A3B1DSQ8_9ZZZZ
MRQGTTVKAIAFFMLTASLLYAEKGVSTQKKKALEKVFQVSKKTTFFTTPLLKSGRVDYIKAFNAYTKPKGVTPEKNGAVYLVKAIGWQEKHEYGSKEEKVYRTNLFTLLGLKKEGKGFYAFPPKGGNEIIDSYSYMKLKIKVFPEFGKEKEKKALEKKLQSDLHAENAKGESVPWKKEERPETWKWIQMNEIPLKLAHRAMEQPFFYLPFARATTNNQQPKTLLSTPTPVRKDCRKIARLLFQRALNHLGENRPDEAAKDLMVIHQLARKIGINGSLSIYLTGVSMEAIANKGDYYLAMHAGFSIEKLKSYTKMLQALSPAFDINKTINVYARCRSLDTIQNLAISSHKEAMEDYKGIGLPNWLTTGHFIFDWDQILTNFNLFYDKINETNSKHFLVQIKLQNQITKNALKSKEKLKELSSKHFALKGLIKGKQYRTHVMGDSLMALLMPAIMQAFTGEQEILMKQEMNIVHFHLELYKRKNGKYPTKLNALLPNYLAKIPQDRFTEKQNLKYLSDGKSFKLYSVGRDLKDNKGASWGESPDGNDIVIKVP